MKNIWIVFKVILFSMLLTFFVFPFLIEVGFVKRLLNKTEIKLFIGATSALWLCLVFSWGKARILWGRYKNTYKLGKGEFVFPDHIVMFTIFSILFVYLFQRRLIPKVSVEFSIFMYFNIVIIIVWFLLSYFLKNKKGQMLFGKMHPLSDEPIQFATDDLLGREKFIEDLYKEIINLPFNDSFVFGICGGWGEGKTSVLNLLRNKLMPNEHYLIINFDPWLFKNEEAILTAFYRQIEQVISQNFIFPDIKRTFAKYLKLISYDIPNAGLKIDFSHESESLEAVKNRIESYIEQTKKKIVIFIDDIDRLQAEEILLIFKLVRLNAKFKNTIFILSFDESYIADILEEKWATIGNINKQNVDLVHIRASNAF